MDRGTKWSELRRKHGYAQPYNVKHWCLRQRDGRPLADRTVDGSPTFRETFHDKRPNPLRSAGAILHGHTVGGVSDFMSHRAESCCTASDVTQ